MGLEPSCYECNDPSCFCTDPTCYECLDDTCPTECDDPSCEQTETPTVTPDPGCTDPSCTQIPDPGCTDPSCGGSQPTEPTYDPTEPTEPTFEQKPDNCIGGIRRDDGSYVCLQWEDTTPTEPTCLEGCFLSGNNCFCTGTTTEDTTVCSSGEVYKPGEGCVCDTNGDDEIGYTSGYSECYDSDSVWNSSTGLWDVTNYCKTVQYVHSKRCGRILYSYNCYYTLFKGQQVEGSYYCEDH